MIFQVQYRINSNTYLDDFEANSDQDILNLFEDLSSCEVVEIRKYKYEGFSPIPKDDNNYIHSAKCYLSVTDGFKHSFTMPKIKTTIDDQDLQDLILNHLLVNDKKPDYLSTNFNFKM